MKTLKRRWTALAGICAGGLIFAITALTAWSQTAPFLTVAPTGTNQLAITITNGVSGANYELWWTPVLANPDYPWMAAAVGSTGQTNFTVSIGPYATGFYEAVWDTNTTPLWEAADPDNQSAGILTVYIDSPTNGMVLQ